jgi:hypothetical protein
MNGELVSKSVSMVRLTESVIPDQGVAFTFILVNYGRLIFPVNVYYKQQ